MNRKGDGTLLSPVRQSFYFRDLTSAHMGCGRTLLHHSTGLCIHCLIMENFNRVLGFLLCLSLDLISVSSLELLPLENRVQSFNPWSFKNDGSHFLLYFQSCQSEELCIYSLLSDCHFYSPPTTWQDLFWRRHLQNNNSFFNFVTAFKNF